MLWRLKLTSLVVNRRLTFTYQFKFTNQGTLPTIQEEETDVSTTGFAPQSGAERFGVTINTPSTKTTEEITQFSDNTPAFDYVVDSQPDSTFMVSDTNDDGLENFFSRPIKIHSYGWGVDEQVQLFQKFNPWQDYFENPRVINRIANFNLLRCKLHVKFVINGNAFYYGRAIAAYNPLPDDDDLTLDRGFFIQDVVAASQRPHIYLDPTASAGGTLSLPFFWPENYLNIPEQDWRKMGEIVMTGMTNLKHANGATGPESVISISVFAWATEVKLSVPTSSTPGSLTPQSGDEYGKGPISRPAAIVARAAGHLTKIPVIGDRKSVV